MIDEHSGLDPAQVLEALRDEVPSQLSSQQQSRLLFRIETSVAGLSAVASVGSVSVSGTTLNSGFDAPISMSDRLSAQLAAHPISTLVTMLALGGALGAGTHASVTSRHHQSINAPGVSSQVATQAPAAIASSQEPVTAISDLPQVAAAQRAPDGVSANQRANAAAGKAQAAMPPEVPAEAPSLAEQLALLETARSAVARKDAAAAMRALDAHRVQFPTSELAEEREALTIRALAMANRASDAKSRLARFETEFPGSLMLPSLKQKVGNFE
jgi:hypothetical protein